MFSIKPSSIDPEIVLFDTYTSRLLPGQENAVQRIIQILCTEGDPPTASRRSV